MNITRVKLFLLILIAVFLVSCEGDQQRKFLYLQGFTQGTSYHIAYNSPDSIDYHDQIRIIFDEIDYSMSTYNPESVISGINRNDPGVVADDYFISVFERAREISALTGGAFDITVAPLVNAWGFGFKEMENVTPALIDSLLHFVGLEKVGLDENMEVVKKHPDIMIDMNAIAKGYTVDVVAEFFDDKGVTDYMIEIGGEIRLKGANRNNQLWRIGIDKPVDDPTDISRELEEVLHLTGTSLATSGNYRRYYEKDGQRFAHTIDPVSGYPVQHNLLSATVIAPTCMDADAFATAFMVMGLEKSMEMANSNPELEAYFIYDLGGLTAIAYTAGIEEMISR
ncbi:MAG: FAD:protein FMN transferase [Bacteroidales bacterium]